MNEVPLIDDGRLAAFKVDVRDDGADKHGLERGGWEFVGQPESFGRGDDVVGFAVEQIDRSREHGEDGVGGEVCQLSGTLLV